MESLQHTVKITDGMLRALVQRLNNKIDGMDTNTNTNTTAGPVAMINVAKQLEASLTQVQRVHKQLESTLGRVVEHEHATKQATKQAVGQPKESAESALVTDKLSKLAAIFGGPSTGGTINGNMEGGDSEKAMGRLETKLDTLTAKLEKSHELEISTLRREKQELVSKLTKAHKTTLTERLTAVKKALLEIKDGAIAPVSKKSAVENSTPGTANPSVNPGEDSQQLSLPAAPSTRPTNAASTTQTSNAAAIQLDNPFGNPPSTPLSNPWPFAAAQPPAVSALAGPDRKRRRDSKDEGSAQPLA